MGYKGGTDFTTENQSAAGGALAEGPLGSEGSEGSEGSPDLLRRFGRVDHFRVLLFTISPPIWSLPLLHPFL